MKYHGGKTRIGKRIADAILAFITLYCSVDKKANFTGYWDPTVGVLGVTKRLVVPLKERFPDIKFYASDINYPLIQFWQAVQNNFKPPCELSLQEYTYLRETKETQDPLHTFVQHASSFGGRPFAARLPLPTINRQLNSACKNIERMKPEIKQIQFFPFDMFDSRFQPKNFIMYIDPPYYYSRNTQGLHKTLYNFDNEKFWDIASKLSKDNLIFVSETLTLRPKEWVEIYSFLFKNRFGTREYSRTERIFVHQCNIPKMIQTRKVFRERSR